jgi:hypothetical protein
LSERTSRRAGIRLQRDADVAVIRVRNHLPNAKINAVHAVQMAPHSSHLNAELDEKH